MKAKDICKILKEVKYKGHTITKFEDEFMQDFTMIDNDLTKLYDSIEDAKRVLRGEQPHYEILEENVPRSWW